MKKVLTRSEMLTLWRTLRAAEPLRLDCTVSRLDGPDYEGILSAEMRAWYLDLLDHGPESAIVASDTAAMAQVATIDGLTMIEAPSDCRRILRVGFGGWGSTIEPVADPEAVRRLAANPFWRRPAAARTGPRSLIVCGARGALTRLECAVDHGEQSYIFDDSALSSILTE